MGKRLGRAHRANAPAFTPAAWMPPRLRGGRFTITLRTAPRPPRQCPRVYARDEKRGQVQFCWLSAQVK